MNSKKILFLHPNYPGQFKTLAVAIGALGNIDAKFLCMTNYGTRIKGIKDLIIKGNRGQTAMDHLKLGEIDKMQFRADSYRLAFASLRDNGWSPDIVIGHTGWGCGIHVKDIWSNCLFIGYSEWWFNLNSTFTDSALQDPHMGIQEKLQIKSLKRNQFMALELCTADEIISPSAYQRSQLPKTLQNKCRIICDGIDVQFFSKKIVQPSKEPLITYGTRGMEPMRCFRQFIKSIPHIIRAVPSARIEIAGEDEICYGGLPPNNKQTWGEWAKQYLQDANVEKQVVWTGRMNIGTYREWLQRSWCHVYLSQPFVVSWSLLESLVTGIPIVANKTLPIQEFASNVEGVHTISSLNPNELLKGVLLAITEENTQKVGLKRHSREKITESLSADNALRKWELVTGMELHTRN